MTANCPSELRGTRPASGSSAIDASDVGFAVSPENEHALGLRGFARRQFDMRMLLEVGGLPSQEGLASHLLSRAALS